jgi:anti-sigma regulatory factor (Ser/Thr protein kinase)
MTAVQAFLKHLSHREGAPMMRPEAIANMLQTFFRTNFANVSYMTALICIHRPLLGEVEWISCGAPDLVVMEDGKKLVVNPDHRGGLPIGILPETIYTRNDTVRTELTARALCVACTDGLMDQSRDAAGVEKLPRDVLARLRNEVSAAARTDGSLMSVLPKFMTACESFGYDKQQDDITVLVFGAHVFLPGIYEATIPLTPGDIDRGAQAMGDWCREQKWDEGLIGRLQVVFEEKLMNIHDHGFDDRDRLREVVSFRLRTCCDTAELTVWDYGTPEPSIKVVAGDSDTVFERENQTLHDHGRGRLMVRELCRGIRRARFADMNETVYYIPRNP